MKTYLPVCKETTASVEADQPPENEWTILHQTMSIKYKNLERGMIYHN